MADRRRAKKPFTIGERLEWAREAGEQGNVWARHYYRDMTAAIETNPLIAQIVAGPEPLREGEE